MTSAALTTDRSPASTSPAGTSRRPGLLAALRWELRKLRAQARTRYTLLGCLIAPALIVVVLNSQQRPPKDTLYGRHIHDSGYAVPLLILGFAAPWVFPLPTALVAGDIFASEDSYGTWKTVLTRSVSRAQLFWAKTAAAAALSLTGCGSADVTRPRLEASLTPTFTKVFVHQQTDIYGHPGVTAATVAAHASCDRGGPKVADTGPGADWICMVKYNDETGAAREGKFELQAKANACYTASGPSKLIGLVTITGRNGKDVPNPVFEFDGCFDPRS